MQIQNYNNNKKNLYIHIRNKEYKIIFLELYNIILIITHKNGITFLQSISPKNTIAK